MALEKRISYANFATHGEALHREAGRGEDRAVRALDMALVRVHERAHDVLQRAEFVCALSCSLRYLFFAATL